MAAPEVKNFSCLHHDFEEREPETNKAGAILHRRYRCRHCHLPISTPGSGQFGMRQIFFGNLAK